MTISEVISSGDKFHRKMVALEGQVGELKFKEMANGRKFTLFRFFEDDPEKRINVYARGFVEGIENGSKIRIWGFYRKHKRYFLKKQKHTMKANKIQILSDEALEGQVGGLKFKEMPNGRKFTLFRFFDNDPEKRINVYARGFVEGIENGSRIRIWGFYRKHKRYFLRKHKNTMKANKIQFLGGK